MKNEDLIKALQKCARECINCATKCLDEDNLQKMVPCIRTDHECAEICSATAKVLAMNGSKAASMVKTCESICRECAEECDKHEHQHCKDCAKACRECAEACTKFAA